MSRIREKFIESILTLRENEPEDTVSLTYEQYKKYVEEELAEKSYNIQSYDEWRMNIKMDNDEDYRDDVLDDDDWYRDDWDDTTDQERFDDVLSMYDIAGING
jgi:hypothetical protein